MRQFVADSELDEKGCLTVEGKNFRYLASVLRIKCGDMIDTRLKDGTLQPMTAAKIDTKARKIILQAAGPNLSRDEDTLSAPPLSELPKLEVHLFQFIAKPQKMDLIIRQATECGVKEIIPVMGEFCQKGNVESAKIKSSGSDPRWQRIITEARQQSGSPVDTKIHSAVTVKEAGEIWKSISSENSRGVVLYEQTSGTKTLHEAFKNADGIERACIAVGAEGGISPEEVEILSGYGFIPVHLETNILRCETASLYGIAALKTVAENSEKGEI